jgi:hypothetical protein
MWVAAATAALSIVSLFAFADSPGYVDATITVVLAGLILGWIVRDQVG